MQFRFSSADVQAAHRPASPTQCSDMCQLLRYKTPSAPRKCPSTIISGRLAPVVKPSCKAYVATH
jgi:hypothetical protein